MVSDNFKDGRKDALRTTSGQTRMITKDPIEVNPEIQIREWYDQDLFFHDNCLIMMRIFNFKWYDLWLSVMISENLHYDVTLKMGMEIGWRLVF